MDIFSKLTREHAHILRGLACMEAARTAVEENRHPPVVLFKEAVLFFSQYADRLHHYKEEYLLFSVLASKKEGGIDLEMGALRHQHELNRQLLEKIEKALHGYETGSEIAVTTVLKHLSAYVSILRRHIYREDHLFFPMAEAELSKEEKKRLKADFLVEEEGFDAGTIVNENRLRLQKLEGMVAEI